MDSMSSFLHSFPCSIKYINHPRKGENFHLQLTLHKIFGTKSYENIHTIDGTIHAPYKNIAICWKLLKDDNKWDSCHEKATIFQMPNKLQELLPPSYCSTIQIPSTLTRSVIIKLFFKMLKLSKKILNNKNCETIYIYINTLIFFKIISKLINYSINMCQNYQSITITLSHFGFDIKIISCMTF
jgi:hypothetical protein